MRTIGFNDEDIKECKLALANQNITPLQSAFLIQYINNIEANLDKLEQENSILKENEKLRSCNTDYYNLICTLTSKISLINKYINEEKNLIPLHIKDYINKIITDKTIDLGEYVNENMEISSN